MQNAYPFKLIAFYVCSLNHLGIGYKKFINTNLDIRFFLKLYLAHTTLGVSG